MKRLLLPMLAAIIAACDHSDDATLGASGVLGPWRLVERGFSIGAGYTVEPALEDPPLSITFISEEEFTTTLDGFQRYRFYTLNKVNNVNHSISFFITKPDPFSPSDPNRKVFSISYEGDKLRLEPSYPSKCIEGCHLGFKRFTGSSE